MLTTVQRSQQHVVRCIKVVEWGLGSRGLRMVAAFWVAITVKVTQEASVVPRLWTRCHRDIILVVSYDTEGNGGHILPSTYRGQ